MPLSSGAVGAADPPPGGEQPKQNVQAVGTQKDDPRGRRAVREPGEDAPVDEGGAGALVTAEHRGACQKDEERHQSAADDQRNERERELTPPAAQALPSSIKHEAGHGSL